MPPLKLAIIGGGPSAFYVASRLLQTIGRSHPHDSLRIHIYDRLWSPHGLVRSGAALLHDFFEETATGLSHRYGRAGTDEYIVIIILW